MSKQKDIYAEDDFIQIGDYRLPLQKAWELFEVMELHKMSKKEIEIFKEVTYAAVDTKMIDDSIGA